jgi:hypothetical protein
VELAAGSMTAETRRFLRANGHWMVVLTRGADGMVEEDGVDGKKVLQNRLPSCARGPRKLGTTWSAMRSIEEGAHRRSVEVGDGIRCRGQKGEARVAKPSGKTP